MSVFAPVFRLILIFIFFFFFAVAIFYLISFQSKENPCNAMFYYETFFPPGNIEKLGECRNCYRKQKCIMASGEWMYKSSTYFCAHLESKMQRQSQMGFCFSTQRWKVSELSIKNPSFYDSSLILQVYHLIYSTAGKRPKKDKHLAWWQRKL